MSVISKSKCGLGIPSFKEMSERLWVRKRHGFMNNTQVEMQHIWQETSHLHTVTDSLLAEEHTATNAMTSLHSTQEENALTHVLSLSVQGQAVKVINDNISRQSINTWAAVLESMPSHIFNFARKALIQQLPTASNLHRWKNIDKPKCCLCQWRIHRGGAIGAIPLTGWKNIFSQYLYCSLLKKYLIFCFYNTINWWSISFFGYKLCH